MNKYAINHEYSKSIKLAADLNIIQNYYNLTFMD